MNNDTIIAIMVTATVSGVIGFLIKQFLSAPEKSRLADKELSDRMTKIGKECSDRMTKIGKECSDRISLLEKDVAVLTETKVNDMQVRQIIHEQLEPIVKQQENIVEKQNEISEGQMELKLTVSAINSNIEALKTLIIKNNEPTPT